MFTDVEKAYAKWSSSYDSDVNRTRDLCLKINQQLLNNLAGKMIVEAGCGTGNHTLRLAEKSKSVIAFDFSEDMLKIAQQKAKNDNVKFFQHDITKIWPVENESADLIIINLVLEHIEDLNFIFKEAFRVLKIQGEVFVCELHPEKQKIGSKARFHDPETNEQSQIISYFHSKEDFQHACSMTGFKEIKLNDWYDDDPSIPRILTVNSKKF